MADRPLVGALTGRLQALHTQLQAFVERVDSLGNSPGGGRDPQVEGASPQPLLSESTDPSEAAHRAALPCSADVQDGPNTAEEKVQEKNHAPPPPRHSFSHICYQSFDLEIEYVVGFLIFLLLLVCFSCFSILSYVRSYT